MGYEIILNITWIALLLIVLLIVVVGHKEILKAVKENKYEGYDKFMMKYLKHATKIYVFGILWIILCVLIKIVKILIH